MVYSVDLVLKYAASQYEINIQLLNSFDLALSAEKRPLSFGWTESLQPISMSTINLTTRIVLLCHAKQLTYHMQTEAYLDIHFSFRLLGPLDK